MNIEDKREKPLQSAGEFEKSENMSDLLPALAILKGIELRSVTFKLDPFVLYNRYGQILYEWPCEYKPSWPEVYEIVERVGGSQ